MFPEDNDVMAEAGELVSAALGLGPGEDLDDETDNPQGDDTASGGEGDDTAGGAEGDDTVDGAEGEAKPPVTPAAGTDAVKMPGSWAAKAALWEAASPELRAQIAQREADFHSGIEGYKEHAGIGKAVNDLFAPYTEVLKANNTDALSVTQNLLQSQAILAFGKPEQKVELLKELIQTYEIDPAALGIAGEGVAPDAAVTALQESNRALQSRLDQMQRAFDAQQQSSLRSQVNAFLADPNFPHAKTLSVEIANLIKADPSLTLEKAYDKALWLNPETRQAKLKADADAAKAEAERKLREQQEKLKGRTPRTRSREVTANSQGGPLGNLVGSIVEEIDKRNR